MSDEYKGPVYFALGDFDVGDRTIDLGRGVKIVPAKASIHLPVLLENLNKESQEVKLHVKGPDGRPHREAPLYWNIPSRSVSIGAEISIDQSYFTLHNDQLKAAWFVMSMIRMWATPNVSLVGVSFTSFTAMSNADVEKPVIYPLEVGVRHVHMTVKNEDNLDRGAEWIGKHCWDAYDLHEKNAREGLQNPTLFELASGMK